MLIKNIKAQKDLFTLLTVLGEKNTIHHCIEMNTLDWVLQHYQPTKFTSIFRVSGVFSTLDLLH